MYLPVAYEGANGGTHSLSMPDASFPEWVGTDEERAEAIARCVARAVDYARQVGSFEELRGRYAAGEYGGAFIIAPLRRMLESTD